MFHFCNDELQAILVAFQSLPFLGSWVTWLKGKLKPNPHCCNEDHYPHVPGTTIRQFQDGRCVICGEREARHDGVYCPPEWLRDIELGSGR